MMKMYQDFSAPMKKCARGLALLLLAGLAASSFAFALYEAVASREIAGSRVPVRQIAISGEGKISVKPDIATVRATVVTLARRVGDAQADDAVRSNAVMDFLKSQGIAEKDVKTASYSITPQYQYAAHQLCIGGSCPPQGLPTIVSYQVRHTIEVKIRDLKKADGVLEGVVTSGANEVDVLQFGIDDETAVKAAARKAAIEDAQNKAKILARDLGIRLKRIVSFSESGERMPIFRQSLANFDAASASGAPQVAPGEQEIKSSVTITYEFR